MLNLYLRTAVRNLWKNKTFSLLNIFGLAIGICCAGLIFLWVEDETTFDDIHSKKEQLYRVNINATFDGTVYTMGSTPRPLMSALINEIPGVVNAARMSDEKQQSLFRAGERSLYMTGRYADAALFSLFSFSFTEGNAFTQPNSLVLTEDAAKKLLGEIENAVGKTVLVDNEHQFMICGVVKNMPANSSLQFEWLAPYSLRLHPEDAQSWDSFGPLTYVEISKEAKLSAINSSLDQLVRKKTNGEKTAFLWPMANWQLYNEFKDGKPTGSGRIKEIRLMSVIAWIILLIACINFMNLATANGQKRFKEVGIHKTLGARRARLALQFMGEALLISTVSALLSVLLMKLSLPLFNLFMQKQLELNIFDPGHITALLAIALICGLVAGSYPAFYLSSFKPALVLKGLKSKAGAAVFIRKVLVVLQFIISVIFIVSTIVVYRQVQFVKNRELGLDKENLLEIDMQRDMLKKFTAIKTDLLNTGLFVNAAMTDHTTLAGGDTDDRFRWQGKPEDRQVMIAFRNVTPEYVSTSGMKIIEGRDFTADVLAEKNNVIITQSFARLLSNESAIGKIIQSPRGNKEGLFTNLTVVGVINDYVYGNVFGYAGPVILFCQQSNEASLVYARLKPKVNAAEAIEKIAAVTKLYNPGFPLTYSFVDDQFNAKFSNAMLTGKMSGVFSILAIIISCLGLFGLAAYTAVQRTKEISIRKVLGASVLGLARLLSRDFLQLVSIACLIAFPAAWWIMRNWLQGYEYRVPLSWWIFALAGFTAVFIALLTVSFQAIRTAMANPVKSLRADQ